MVKIKETVWCGREVGERKVYNSLGEFLFAVEPMLPTVEVETGVVPALISAYSERDHRGFQQVLKEIEDLVNRSTVSRMMFANICEPTYGTTNNYVEYELVSLSDGYGIIYPKCTPDGKLVFYDEVGQEYPKSTILRALNISRIDYECLPSGTVVLRFPGTRPGGRYVPSRLSPSSIGYMIDEAMGVI